MSYEDQVPYPFAEHFWWVTRVHQYRASLKAVFPQLYVVTYFNHKMPIFTRNETDRPDVYGFDVYHQDDDDLRREQLVPSIGDQIASYLLFRYEDKIHHLCWWGRIWTPADEWQPIDWMPHDYREMLHVYFTPEEGDDEANAPPLPSE